ncbi:MAG: hypothetical protein LBB79_06305 [Prevotellaceae bacterium]|nr:hypothetical protein [Prevotellaceae bacterium]
MSRYKKQAVFLLLLHFENNGCLYKNASKLMAKEKTKESVPEVFMNPKTDFGFKKVLGNELLLKHCPKKLRVSNIFH